jgi:hypothetical protein
MTIPPPSRAASPATEHPIPLGATIDTHELLALARSRAAYFTDLEGDPFAELSPVAGGHGARTVGMTFPADRAQC